MTHIIIADILYLLLLWSVDIIHLISGNTGCRMEKKNKPVDEIKDYLLKNGYKPGHRIPTQLEFSEKLGISARLLRDGINILVNQGFLIPKGRAGTFVSNPQRESVVEPIRWFYETKNIPDYELIRARGVLETAIIKEACSNRTTKDLLLLQQIVDNQSVQDISSKEELILDKEFHIQLISCAHNKALDVVGNVVLLQLDLLYERGLYPSNDQIRPDDHQKILDAVYERNSSLAAELIATHIERCLALANCDIKNPSEIKN